MMNEVIKIEELKRSYGDIVAVNGVSYSVAKGEMFGLVGPDGAGKTTTIRMLIGLLKPDSGNAWLLGYDLKPRRIKSKTKLVISHKDFHFMAILRLMRTLSSLQTFTELRTIKKEGMNCLSLQD